MAPPTPGYSGTPLARKLGLAPGLRAAVLDAPPGYLDWLAPLPAGWRFGHTLNPGLDWVHVFATRRELLGPRLAEARRLLPATAVVWVSWPKKASKQPTDLTEDVLRAEALPLGFVDVKVCAVSEVWSGLKLVVRKALR